MSEERINIINKAIKLRELSIRGVDGEKDNAKRMYDAFVIKHNITNDEINTSSYKNNNEYANMTSKEFFKHIEVDINMLGFSMVLVGLGRLFKNDNVSNAGMDLFKESVKKREEPKK